MKNPAWMILFLAATGGTPAVPEEAPYFYANWQSLARENPAPRWFRDAKLGIYLHWGVYSVPAYGDEWYPHWMHNKGIVRNGYDFYQHHVDTYGEPAKFGYHHFVPLFRAEHFDAEAWARLFAESGARFGGLVAEHHDGFAMWDSEVTPWNAVEMGPKRDVLGELARALRRQGMKFVTTFHHARNLQRYADQPEEATRPIENPHNRYRDSHYPYVEGMPPTSEDPVLRLLYGNLPEAEWLERMWWGKLKEVIDRYEPDLIYFDSWLDKIPEPYLQRFCAYYFNRAAERGQEVVITRKQGDLPLSVSLADYEKGRLTEIADQPWLTDDTISLGSWSYTTDLEIKPLRMVLHGFIDLVSKNGCLMLNISPKADGTIPTEQQEVLRELGAWLRVNGEAIYETRPWQVYGEGPTKLEKGGHFIKEPTYTAEDIRYTRSKDDLFLYATFLGRPEAGKKLVLSAVRMPTFVQKVEMLGSAEPVVWEEGPRGLTLRMPAEAPSELAVCFKITQRFSTWNK